MCFQWGAGEIQSRRRNKSGMVTGSSSFELGGDGYATVDDDSAVRTRTASRTASSAPASSTAAAATMATAATVDAAASTPVSMAVTAPWIWHPCSAHFGSTDGLAKRIVVSIKIPLHGCGISSKPKSWDCSCRPGANTNGLINGQFESNRLGIGTSPLARSMNSMPSLRKTSLHHGIIIRETSIQHLDEQDQYQQQEFQFQTFVNSRGWQGIRESLYFIKAGVEAIIEDEVTSRFKAEQLASWNMLTRTSISFYHFLSSMAASSGSSNGHSAARRPTFGLNAPRPRTARWCTTAQCTNLSHRHEIRLALRRAFWNSSEQSYFRYLLQMMTSWAMICHVWYLPLMTKEVLPEVSAVHLRLPPSSASSTPIRSTMMADNDEKEYNHSQQDHHNHSSPAFGSANANENKENDGDRDGTNNTEQRRQRSK
ncbi:hypothetical protein niasHS_015589 [Heterodera schachtii]|uniref:Uncharacterized protein n=1 Tax=Heterodera schachtii TaxID=97005 RepID=A0ABD2HZQ9_HETSC